MSYKKKIIDGKEVKYWESVEEEHPDTSELQPKVENTLETESKEIPGAINEVLNLTKKPTIQNIFNQAKEMPVGGAIFTRIISLLSLIENYSDAIIYVNEDYSSTGTAKHYFRASDGNVITITLPVDIVDKSGEAPKTLSPRSVIISCNDFICTGGHGEKLEPVYDTLMNDGSRAFLLTKEDSSYKRLFSKVYAHGGFYMVRSGAEYADESIYTLAGMTTESAANSHFPWPCAYIQLLDKNGSQVQSTSGVDYIADAFTGIKGCFTRAISLEDGEESAVIKIELEVIAPLTTVNGVEAAWVDYAEITDALGQGERCAVTVHYNPDDLEEVVEPEEEPAESVEEPAEPVEEPAEPVDEGNGGTE